MDKGTQMLLVIVPRRVKALQLQKKLKIFFFPGTNIVDEFRLFCYNSSLRGYGRESLAAQICGGARLMEEHRESKKVVGIKQVKKAVREGRALEVFLADDADPALTEPLEDACLDAKVRTSHVPSMKELGKTFGISVGAACAAIVR